MGQPEQLNSKIYSVYKNISSMPVDEIERLRETIQTEIEAEKHRCRNVDKVHSFVDLLMDTCIEAVKLKSHQDAPCVEPALVAEVIESLPQQDDSISFAI